MEKKKSKTLFFIFTLVFFYQLNATVVILNGLTHIHNTEKGSVLKGEIIMQNNSKVSDELVKIYLTDLKQDCAGSTYGILDDNARSIAKWVTFSTNEKVLVPNEKYTLFYTIEIPEDIDYGSFWGVIMVEISKPISESYESGIKINSKIRYGVQIVANIGERINPEIQFVDVSIVKKNKLEYKVDVQLKNKGVYLVQPALILELFNDLGESVKKVQSVFKKVYPKNCKSFQIPISGLPPGEYDGVLVADYGGDIYGINVSLNLTKD